MTSSRGKKVMISGNQFTATENENKMTMVRIKNRHFYIYKINTTSQKIGQAYYASYLAQYRNLRIISHTVNKIKAAVVTMTTKQTTTLS